MIIKATFDDGESAPKAKVPTGPTMCTAPSCAARNLALAYKIAGLIDRGLLLDFSSAARALGISQPRVTHLMGLLLLAPEVQEAILFGELAFGDKELRALARIADWGEQKATVASRTDRHRLRPLGG